MTVAPPELPKGIIHKFDQVANEQQRQVAVDEVASWFNERTGNGLAFQRAGVVHGSTYRDRSTIVIVPMRDPMIHWQVVQSWQSLIAPMNDKRCFLFVVADEVGVAYTATIQNILANAELAKWKYVLTLESDNLPPPDAHVRLCETIEDGGYDGVSGLYWTKGEINMPMAYGDPEEFKRTGVLEFRPRDVRPALERGQVMPVNGIACGCSLYRMDLFRDVPSPWFVTLSDVMPSGGVAGMTQDLYMCRSAIAHGKRFAVDLRVRVGHLDTRTGEIY